MEETKSPKNDNSTERKLVDLKPPYPVYPGEIPDEDFKALRQVTSGQLFGPRDLPRPAS